MDPFLVAACVAVGASAGFLAGMFGVGGGIIIVPMLTLLFSLAGFPSEGIVHVAIATSLATILFTSTASIIAHARRGAVLWRVAAVLTPGIALGSWFGGALAAVLSGRALSAVFALVVVLAAVNLMRRKPVRPHRRLPHWPGLTAVGGVIGASSGLIGGGGGFMATPFMLWCNVPVHNAIATSAVLGFPIALAGTLSNVVHGWGAPDRPPDSLGFVYVPALLVVAACSVLLAPWGARLAHRLEGRRLQGVFARFLFVMGGYMLWKALSS